ncbi:Pyridoxal phosphate-dependent transferase [Elaphomyces granulatus]|jgi:glutamate/tyrosine decarboxylase-like PLP-dependent enzyme
MDLKIPVAFSEELLENYRELWQVALSYWELDILPRSNDLVRAQGCLRKDLPDEGLGFEYIRRHIMQDLIPGFNGGSISPNYYGFVTGGVTPAALFADNVVSAYDQNVQVHIPGHSIATEVEDATLGLLTDLFRLDRQTWKNGTFTTGATASNILGLACGREFVLRAAAEKQGNHIASVGEYGIFEVLQAAGLSGLQILSTMPHSSITKAAGILGFGRGHVKSVSQEKNPLQFDINLLEREISRKDRASIVVISCGEVNTGHFATAGIQQLQQLRKLCDQYGSWLHVDGAFGIFGRILDEDVSEFASITRGCEGLDLADSITGDAHKLLNVPYDCGFFLCRHKNLAESVFQNPNAAYLSSGGIDDSAIPSPLNIGVENSRRFRALPVYASLVSYGRKGYQDILQRQILLARMIAGWIFDHPCYMALPLTGTKAELLEKTFIIVLFRAKDEGLNRQLGTKINATSKIFVSGTTWQGEPACRIAISNWRVDENRDFTLLTKVLDHISDGNNQGGSAFNNHIFCMN